MSEDPLTGIEAHRLLNSVSAIRGLVSLARSLRAEDPTDAEIDRILLSAEERASEVADRLHQHVRGLPEVIDLDAGSPSHEPSIADQQPHPQDL